MWNRFIGFGFTVVDSFGPECLKQITIGRRRNANQSKKMYTKLEKLGENVGLNNSEVLAAIPTNTSLNLQVGSSCLTWCFTCFGFLILLFIALFTAIFPGLDLITTTTTATTTTTTTITTTTGSSTYVPGTFYGTITPQDFKKRKFAEIMLYFGV